MEHDDALNHIRGTMEEGDLGRLTEGVRGMYHQEWNGAEQVTRAFILVYHPDTHPPIPVAEFALLKAADKVPINEGPGVETWSSSDRCRGSVSTTAACAATPTRP